MLFFINDYSKKETMIAGGIIFMVGVKNKLWYGTAHLERDAWDICAREFVAFDQITVIVVKCILSIVKFFSH